MDEEEAIIEARGLPEGLHMTAHTRSCQLYLISPAAIDAAFADALAAVLDATPVAAFQLRLKGVDEHEIARLGEPLRQICADRETAFIVNDSIALAKRLGADGVHLGQEDGDPREARKLLGHEAQIGVTCHNSRHMAMEAGERGADYVAFGSFYQTGTKRVEHYADPDILAWWSRLFELPCVAIGGITPQTAPELAAAGADFVAVSAAVWANPAGPVAAAHDFERALALRNPK